MKYAVDYLEKRTRNHCHRVGMMAREIAEEYDVGITPELAFLCGLYHDVGKIYIPDALLQKARMTHTESEKSKQHVAFGYEFALNNEELSHLSSSERTLIALSAAFHHENVSATGYLKGENIENFPLIVGLIAILNYYDHVCYTPYYKKVADEKIHVIMMSNQSGVSFSAPAMDIFLKWYSKKRENISEK